MKTISKGLERAENSTGSPGQTVVWVAPGQTLSVEDGGITYLEARANGKGVVFYLTNEAAREIGIALLLASEGVE